jgi:hypothetical protein
MWLAMLEVFVVDMIGAEADQDGANSVGRCGQH